MQTGNDARAQSPGDASTDDLPDAVLVARIGDGCEQAFRALLARHLDRFVAVAERVTGERDSAEDAVQEAFIKLWRKARRFNARKARFTTWFYRIVVNACLDEKRKRRPGQLDEAYEERDDTPGAGAQMERAEAARDVKKALDAIPDRQRAAVVLCYYEGLSNKEAAEVLDIKVKALESLLVRGRQNLKAALADDAPGLLNSLKTDR